ncbi:hypothetical protein [Caballeronia sp. BR00000012568055]|uniref:hypothetical protein n=1 Tax=Caballeronia sp. BR00000012568055 TaxID=2918761 RepID=UPI0023F81CC3|nr:hypothetical protein [Caballeronia sp. BR00000012568055]
MSILRASKWSFASGIGRKADESNGVRIDIVLMSGGAFALNDPQQKEHRFYFARAELPTSNAPMPEIRLPTMRLPAFVSAEPTEAKDPKKQNDAAPSDDAKKAAADSQRQSLPVRPSVFMTQAFQGGELSQRDFKGAAVYVQAGNGPRIFASSDSSALLLGINAAQLMMGLSSPSNFRLAEQAIASARAVLMIEGVSVRVSGNGQGILIGHVN